MILDETHMRTLGYRAIDLLVDHFATVANKHVSDTATQGDLDRLREPVPTSPSDPAELLNLLDAAVLATSAHIDHPRFFAFVPGPSNFVSVLGDLLASGFNVFSGTSLSGAAAAQLELTTLDWLRTLCGLPASAGGLFTSGGSMANLIALAAARETRLGRRADNAVVYASDQTHSSVWRALAVLGFRNEQLRWIPSDPQFRMPVSALITAIRQDVDAGLQPFAVVGNAGTTNTGAVDPLRELADVARSHGLWLHVDAAYGGAAVFSKSSKSMRAGLEAADSLTIDPHKWLFQPIGIGCVLVKNVKWLEQTFQVVQDYLRDAAQRTQNTNFCDRGIELTRPFRALKLWLCLKTFGTEAISQAIQHGIALAELAEADLRRRPNWQIVTSAQLGILTFRYAPPGCSDSESDRLSEALASSLKDDGFAMLSTTRLAGRTVCRFCTINPRTSEQDIRDTISRIDALIREC